MPRQVARHATDLFLGGCHYPYPAEDPPSPFGVVRWGALNVSSSFGAERVWAGELWVEITVPIVNQSEVEIEAADPIVVALIDRFSAANPPALHLEDEAGVRLVSLCEARQADFEFRRQGMYVPRVRLDVKFARLSDAANF